MKIGCVRFLNARPLDWGFRLAASSDKSLEIIEDTPAAIYERLSRGELDTALISSIEVLRNRERFDYCPTVGVCAKNEVVSIIYINPASPEPKDSDPFLFPPRRVLADSGSRTSVALLRLLLNIKYNTHIDFVSSHPQEIPEQLEKSDAGLLIGDSALEFLQSNQRSRFNFRDVGAWWHKETGLPFVYALWAYPRERPLPNAFFEESLQIGQEKIDQIIEASNFPETESYLKDILHYHIQAEDRSALQRFSAELEKRGWL